MLPFGVVIPTRNSMPYLPQHVAAASSWLTLATEVVIVDSESTDGTVEFLRAKLQHPNIRVLQRPRGLYQAWNFGAGQLSAKYTYFSTVGDTITLEGINTLIETAEATNSNVVISPPRFVDTKGSDVPTFEWPIQRVIQRLALQEPRTLSNVETMVFALSNGMNSFLGSSASNLYRTETLQKYPFPTTFGHMGDTAWGIMHCAELTVTISPKVCSTFLLHEKEFEPDYSALAPKLLELAQEMKRKLVSEAPPHSDITRSCDLLALIAMECNHQHEINRARKNEFPLLFNFTAWVARMKRNGKRREIRKLRQQIQNAAFV